MKKYLAIVEKAGVALVFAFIFAGIIQLWGSILIQRDIFVWS